MFFGEACAGELWRCQWHCCLIRLQNPTKQHSLQGNLFTESSGEAVDILSCLEKSDLSNERISTYIASWLDTMFWTLYPPHPPTPPLGSLSLLVFFSFTSHPSVSPIWCYQRTASGKGRIADSRGIGGAFSCLFTFEIPGSPLPYFRVNFKFRTLVS